MKGTACLALAAGIIIAAAPPPLLVRYAIPGKLAAALAQKAVAICATHGFDVGAVVTDASGAPRALATGDAVSALSVETTFAKAKAAAQNGYETSKLAAATTAAPGYAAALHTIHPDMLFLGGGVPIRINGEIVGALGVGGASGPDADERCAAEAVASEPAFAPSHH